MLTYLHPEAVKRFLKDNNLQGVTISLEFLEKFGNAFQKMPYENLTKMIRSRSVTDPIARLRLPELLYEEYLRYGTGGTCFSMTYFMQTILRSCGFETYPVMADRPLAPNTHCLSVIIIEGNKYILDPGFMIQKPLPLSEVPTKHHLKHNNIIIGARGAVQIPPHQMKYFTELTSRKKGEIILPYEREESERPVKQYVIATFLNEKTDIRYFMKDKRLTENEFLEYWLDSFSWPTLHNLSITTITKDGYLYARNSFLRKTTFSGRRQERIKKEIELTLGKTFNIDQRIIKSAFDILGQVKREIRKKKEEA